MVRWRMTWAEGKATVGTDLSADPGVETGGRAVMVPPVSPSSLPSGIDIKALNPSRRSREQTERGDGPMPGVGLPGAQNSDPAILPFRLSHYKRTCGAAKLFRASSN